MRVALRQGATKVALLEEQSNTEHFSAEMTAAYRWYRRLRRSSIRAAFATVRAELGEPTVVVQNAGTGVFKVFEHYRNRASG